MKQILLITLFAPCLAFAQYQGNANQKITLGEQTTADGLIYRGVAADTTLTYKSDTAAYFVLDTININLYTYKASASGRKWRQLGSDTAAIAYVNTYGNQTIGGAKTFTGALSGTSATFSGEIIGSTLTDGIITMSAAQINRPSGKVELQYNGANGVRFFGATQYPITFAETTGAATFSSDAYINGLTIGRGGGNVNTNTANGVNALYSNNAGSFNTANGVNALYSNTSGSYNTANGVNALIYNTTGGGNTANGLSSLSSNTSGSLNTANGVDALVLNTGGSNNTAIGVAAGYGVGTNSNTTGGNNIFIGNESVGASAAASNVITLGNGSITTLRAQVTTITALSDRRDKEEILPLNYGLDFINKLTPVSFIWNMRDGGKIGIPEIGFIAQDLQQAQIDSGIKIPNLVYDENPNKLEASYGVLLPILVKAMQEQQVQIEKLKARLLILENK